MSHTPYHHAQMLRTLPDWSKALHPDHASRIVQSLRKDYLDAEGVAYPWFSKLDTLTRAALQRAIAKRDESRAALQAALGALQGITEFCAPLLHRHLNLDVPVDQAQYVYQATEVERPGGIPGGPRPPSEQGNIVPKGAAQYRSLLEAALHNFEGPADTTRLSRLQRSRQDIMPLDRLTLAGFIDACRALDLGQRYQAHLEQIYEGENKQPLLDLAIQARRDEFRVQVRIAACKGLLSPAESLALHGLCADDSSAPTVLDGRPLRCWQLLLLGVPVHEMLFIAPEKNRKHDPVYLYNPVDEDPIRGFASLADAYRYLRDRLLEPAYRSRLVSLALQEQQAELYARLMRQLFSNVDEAPSNPLVPRDSIHLEVNEKALPVRPWASLESSHQVRLRSDARKIAVPTADVDARVRMRNLAYWFELGMNVLNVAAMFVPCLNPLMLALGASQIMGSVFEGISAWEEGDNAQALAQLESVLVNVAVVGAIGAGATLLKASGFVDEMQSIIKDGKDYLWHGALKDYASDASLPAHLEADGQGVYTLQGCRYVRMDGTLYEQVQENGQWRINHPQDPQAYRPALRDNDAGAWRASHENPLQWDDRLLLRRLGPISEGLEDQELDAALQCAGTSGDALRRSQFEGQRPPALLADTLERLRCTRQVDEIIERVRDGKALAAHNNFALPSVVELDGWPADHVIKAYSGPESWGPSTRYGATDFAHPTEIEINRTELENGELSSRIIAQLGEPALAELLPEAITSSDRAKALSEKLATHLDANRAEVFERLYARHDPAPSALSQALSSQFPGLPRFAVDEIMAHTNASERLRLAQGRVPLRVAEAARVMQAQARLSQALLGLYRPRLGNADSQLLDAALHREHPDSNAFERFNIAAADRAHAARLIKQQPIRPAYQPPVRLADGRLGYPLSGRRPRGSQAEQRLQALYPSLSNSERRARVELLRQRGDVAEQIRLLTVERDELDNSLRQWQNQGTADQRPWRSMASQLINGAWSRVADADLSLVIMNIGELPSLLARFDHITRMHIQELDISHVPGDWFQSFPSLRSLRLAQCPQLDFDSLFQALAFTPRLETLELDNNQLASLTSTMRQRLASLSNLRNLVLRANDLQLVAEDLQVLAQLPIERLELQQNRITLDPDMAGHFAQMPNLRVLRLNDNPLLQAPDLTGMTRLAILQLNDCHLQAWPSGLTALMSQADLQLRHLYLSGNPITQVADLDLIVDSPFARAVHEDSMPPLGAFQDQFVGLGLIGNSPFARASRGDQSLSYWEFHDNQLDMQSIERLRDHGVEIAPHSESSDLEETPWLEGASQDQLELWDDLFVRDENPDLLNVINRVAASNQARTNLRGLTRQVWQLLEHAARDEGLRNYLNELAQQFPPTCGDAGTDGFSALEIGVQTFAEITAEGDRPHYLFSFFRKLYRREMVNALAERIHLARQARRSALNRLPADAHPDTVARPALDPLDDITDDQLQLGGVDLIEIRLALRQSLAASLDYPEPSDGMLYRAEAMISPGVERNVEQAVLQLDASAPGRQAWMVQQASWRGYIETHFKRRFDALRTPWDNGTYYLDYCRDPENEAVTALDRTVLEAITDALPQAPLDEAGQLRRMDLNSQQFTQASEAIQAGWKQQIEKLYATITREQDFNN